MVKLSGVFPIHRTFVELAFLFSGFAALTYEIVWQRALVRLTGATLPATACTLAIFMAWMAIGSAVGGRLLKERKDALKIYCVLELLIAVSAIASIFLLSSRCPLWAADTVDTKVRNEQVYFLLTMILAVPTLCIGATFPAVARYAENFIEQPAAALSKLYAINLVGAVAGTICSGFFLLPLLGISKTILFSAVLNAVAAAFAFAARKRLPSVTNPSENSQPVAAQVRSILSFNLLYFAIVTLITSAISMGLEVFWTRYFSLIIGASVYSVSTVLASVIVGLMIGAWCAKKLIATDKSTELIVTLALLGAFISLHTFLNNEWSILLASESICHWITTQFPHVSSFYAMLASRISVVALAATLPAIFLGVIFPLLIGRLKESAGSVADQAGKLYAVSVVGSVCGPLIAGFVAIPHFASTTESGIHTSLQITALVLLALCILSAFFVPREKVSALKALIAVAMILLLGIYFVPPLVFAGPVKMYELARAGYAFVDPSLKKGSEVLGQYNPGEKITFYREGQNCTVMAGIRPDVNLTYLKNDGKTEASLPLDPSKPTPASDWPTQILLGAIPTILAPKLDNVLLIGLGTGATLHSIVVSPQVQHVTVAELEPAVVDASNFFTLINDRVLRAPKVSLRVADGRNVLAESTQRYDAIVSQPAEPWVSGATDLYSKEFWQLAKSRLSDKGVFCQWVQLYAIDTKYLGVLCRTFASVFPNVYIFRPERAGEIILVGFAGDSQISPEQVRKRILEDRVRRELLKVGISTAEEFLATCKADPQAVNRLCQNLSTTAGGGINLDDNVSLEYELPPLIYDQGKLLERNLDELAKVESSAKKANQELLFIQDEPDLAQLKVREKELSNAIEKDFYLANAFVERAFVRGVLGNYKAAMQDANEAIHLTPSNFEGRIAFAKALYAFGDSENALRNVKIASWANPSSSLPFMFVAAHYASKGDWNLAFENYKRTKYYEFNLPTQATSLKDLPSYDMPPAQAEALAITLYEALSKTAEAQKHRAAYRVCTATEPTATALNKALTAILRF